MTEAQRAIEEWGALNAPYYVLLDHSEYSKQYEVEVRSIEGKRARIPVNLNYGLAGRDVGYSEVIKACEAAKGFLERDRRAQQEKAMGLMTARAVEEAHVAQKKVLDGAVMAEMEKQRATQRVALQRELNKLEEHLLNKALMPATSIDSAQYKPVTGRAIGPAIGYNNPYGHGALFPMKNKPPLDSLRDEVEQWCGKALECA